MYGPVHLTVKGTCWNSYSVSAWKDFHSWFSCHFYVCKTGATHM